MSLIPVLLDAIETRLEQTSTEITHLEAALAALTSPATTATAVRSANGGTTKQRRRAVTKRTPESSGAQTAAVSATREPATPEPATPSDPDLPGEPKPAAADSAGSEQSEPIANGATVRTTRRRSSAASASRRGRATAKLDVEALERLLAGATDGLSASQIAAQADASYPATLKLLRELEASGQVRRSGERRSTSWRLITDEDRIAERAAELGRAADAPGRRRGRSRAS
jgi:hypothetical protein